MQARATRRVLIIVVMAAMALALAACAQDTSSGTDSKQSANKTATKPSAWSIKSDCKSCHVVEVKSSSDSACAYSLHATVACTTCHVDSAGVLTTAHKDYSSSKLPTKLSGTEVSGDACVSCHKMEELVAATAASNVLADDNGKNVNPHAMLLDEKHIVGGTAAANLRCSSCHKMHTPELPSTVAQDACLRCHHANVFECHTCHE